MSNKPLPQRPNMPNYGISDETEGLMSWDWVDDQMKESHNYWVCSTRPDGRPHASPVWGVWVDGVLYFAVDATSRKARNFAHSSQVVIHLESGDDTVIFEGTVEQFDDDALFTKVAKAYHVKYPSVNPAEMEPKPAFYRLIPQVAFSWLETDFPKTATRWKF